MTQTENKNAEQLLEQEPENMETPEENKNMEISPKLESLRLLKQDLEEQKALRARQWKLQKICAGCFLVVLALIACLLFSLFPKVTKLGQVLNTTAQLAESAQEALTQVNEIAQEITEKDGLLDSVKGLVASGETTLNQTSDSLNKSFEKINAIDFEALNSAIQGLQRVVEPFSRLLGR